MKRRKDKGLSALERERGNSLFRPADLIIYILTAAVFVGGLIVMLALPDDAPEKISVYSHDELVLEYAFGGEVKIIPGYENRIEIKNEKSGRIVTVYNKKSRYNVIRFDEKKRTVKIVDADCPRKDCEKMTIKKRGDFIACLPNGLRIETEGVAQLVSG